MPLPASRRAERSRSRRRSRSKWSLAPLRRKRDGSSGRFRRQRQDKRLLYNENEELRNTNRWLHDKINLLQKEFDEAKADSRDDIYDLESRLAAASRDAGHYKDECATIQDLYRKQEAKLQQQMSATTTAMRDLIEHIMNLVLATKFIVLFIACTYVHCRWYVFCVYDNVGLVIVLRFNC